MGKWTAAGLAVLAGVLLLATACGGGEDASAGGNASPTGIRVIEITPTGPTTPRARKTPTPSPVATPTPLQVCAPNPDPATPKVLQVLEPVANAQVRVPVHVRGWGSNIGENDKGVSLAVVDQQQKVVQAIRLPPQPREYRVAPAGMEITDFTRPFGADVVLNDVKEPTPYCLWIYQDTDDAGRAKGVVQVPVVILPRQ